MVEYRTTRYFMAIRVCLWRIASVSERKVCHRRRKVFFITHTHTHTKQCVGSLVRFTVRLCVILRCWRGDSEFGSRRFEHLDERDARVLPRREFLHSQHSTAQCTVDDGDCGVLQCACVWWLIHHKIHVWQSWFSCTKPTARFDPAHTCQSWVSCHEA